jgi:hypothetical protein
MYNGKEMRNVIFYSHSSKEEDVIRLERMNNKSGHVLKRAMLRGESHHGKS